jgi:hypothetical protein
MSSIGRGTTHYLEYLCTQAEGKNIHTGIITHTCKINDLIWGDVASICYLISLC